MKKVFIIAEIGNSHEGSVGLAKCFIKTAADCDADAVKFQTHIFDAESLSDAPCPPYFTSESRQEYFKRTAFNTSQMKTLKEYAEQECGLEFISSPFSIEAVELLEEINIKRYKIPSGEVTNIPLLERVAGTGKPVLLSSGMSSWQELDDAVNKLKLNKSGIITLMQCSSIYPCPCRIAGLNVLSQFRQRYPGIRVGFSDHTLSFAASLGAVVLGAEVIEKHLILSRRMYGSDAAHSLIPEEFKQFTQEIRNMEECLNNNVDKNQQAEELKEMKFIFEKSIVSKVAIPKGTKITVDMMAFKKPGGGIKPGRYHSLAGKTAKINIPPNVLISEDMFE